MWSSSSKFYIVSFSRIFSDLNYLFPSFRSLRDSCILTSLVWSFLSLSLFSEFVLFVDSRSCSNIFSFSFRLFISYFFLCKSSFKELYYFSRWANCSISDSIFWKPENFFCRFSMSVLLFSAYNSLYRSIFMTSFFSLIISYSLCSKSLIQHLSSSSRLRLCSWESATSSSSRAFSASNVRSCASRRILSYHSFSFSHLNTLTGSLVQAPFLF